MAMCTSIAHSPRKRSASPAPAKPTVIDKGLHVFLPLSPDDVTDYAADAPAWPDSTLKTDDVCSLHDNLRNNLAGKDESWAPIQAPSLSAILMRLTAFSPAFAELSDSLL
ncbi:hypothetical protein BaRGS_00009424 [Batillaria attramentaria]|uniref:Uncharacterized protein n=1 Tax=Batillaria attramentaria TaxID=370345 RepID=A0ABD0LKH5_9CAEN